MTARAVYVAARSGLRDQARACAALLRSGGVDVTSTWHDNERFVPDLPSYDLDYCTGEADRDVAELRRSTIIVRLSDGQLGTGGNLVEWGVAIALGLRRILVGAPVNVFDLSPDVVRADAGHDTLLKVLLS